MKVSRIHHAGVTVADVDRSLRFYRDLLGMRVVEDVRLTRPEVAALLGTDVLDLHLVNLDTGDGRILELLEYARPRGSTSTTPAATPAAGTSPWR